MPRLALSALALLVVSCGSAHQPGTSLGTYDVVGHPESDSCGANVAAPDPWTFSVELSRDEKTLYWRWLDDRPLLQGPLDGKTAHVAGSTSDDVDGTHGHDGPCVLERDDTLAITLADGETPASFDGTVSYRFTPASGAVCEDQLVRAGGPFDALPCSISYRVSAKRK